MLKAANINETTCILEDDQFAVVLFGPQHLLFGIFHPFVGAQHPLFVVFGLSVGAEHPFVESLSHSVAGCSPTWHFRPILC